MRELVGGDLQNETRIRGSMNLVEYQSLRGFHIAEQELRIGQLTLN
jgi:hypothetical protein